MERGGGEWWREAGGVRRIAVEKGMVVRGVVERGGKGRKTQGGGAAVGYVAFSGSYGVSPLFHDVDETRKIPDTI